MTVLAAPGDTWGISGSTFLTSYFVLAVAGLVIALVWRTVTTGGRTVTGYPSLSPVELAYFSGGEQLAVQAALAGLRTAEAVGPGPLPWTVVAVAPMPPGLGELEYAVHTAARTPQSVAFLLSDPGVRQAMGRIGDRLIADGVLLSPAQRRRVRAGALPLLAVAALGVVRTFAGLANQKPVLYLVLASVVTIAVALRLLKVPRGTRAGWRLLSQARVDNRHLEPNRSPSWVTYGAGGAMLGVALWGTSAWWAADPAFATHAGLARAVATGSGYSGGSDLGSSDSGGSSCSSGGSSCGGGGCGGGCGG
jgi:uncharacterized protein (TIGR04222 family)